MLIKWESKY